MPLKPSHSQIRDVFGQQGYSLDYGACDAIAKAVAHQHNQHQAVVDLSFVCGNVLQCKQNWVCNAKQMWLVVFKAKESGIL